MMNRTKILTTTIFLLILSSCSNSPADKVEGVTSTYCECIANAANIKAKAKCLKDAASSYKEIAKEATKENMPELKQAYNDGMKACK